MKWCASLLTLISTGCGYLKDDLLDIAYPDRCVFIGDFVRHQEFDYQGCEWFMNLKQPSEW